MCTNKKIFNLCIMTIAGGGSEALRGVERAPRQRFLCPKADLALTHSPVGGRSAHSRECAAVACWLCPGFGFCPGGAVKHRALLLRRSRPHPRPPQGGGGRGEGEPRARRRTERRAPRQAAQGGGRTEGRRGAGPRRRTRAGGARQPPGPSGGSPSRRAAPNRRPPQPNKTRILLGCVTANPTKWRGGFVWLGVLRAAVAGG